MKLCLRIFVIEFIIPNIIKVCIINLRILKILKITFRVNKRIFYHKIHLKHRPIEL